MTTDERAHPDHRCPAPRQAVRGAACLLSAAMAGAYLPLPWAVGVVALLLLALLLVMRGQRRPRVPLSPSAVHELLHPISTTAGHVARVADDPTLDATHRASLERALDGTRRTQALVRHFASTSESDSTALVATSQDLTELVREALEDFSPLAGSRRVSMSLDAPSTCTVEVDRTRMRQVLDNLLSNAVKYNTEEGWIDVVLIDREHEVVLCMENPGLTVSPDEAHRVFTDSFRGELAAGTAEGAGLGLGTCRRIIQAHGGQIELHSSRETGTTTVRVALPRHG